MLDELQELAQGGGGVTIPWEAFKDHGDVTLKDMVYGHGGDGLMVGVDDLSGLFQP